jgi:hypothetical protein
MDVIKRFLAAATKVVFFTLFLNGRAEAAGAPGAAEDAQKAWYLLCGLGLASSSYSFESGKLQALANETELENQVRLNYELGVYWALTQRPGTLFGVVFNGGESRSAAGGDELIIDHYLLGFSSIRFFEAERKTGFFVRADIGVAAYRAEARGAEPFSEYSDLGYGVLVGGGYAIQNSRRRSVLFTVNYALRQAGADSISTFGMTVGFLW